MVRPAVLLAAARVLALVKVLKLSGQEKKARGMLDTLAAK